ncbi:MAG: Rossmann-like and DUF2520 domain-containing protein [Lutibacter sp.]
MINVVLFGSGNIASFLAKQFINSEVINLIQVYNRNLSNINYLKNQTDIVDDINEINKKADLYILALKDNIISKFSKQLFLPNRLVVHTSGNTSIDKLKSNSDKGVLYPLQSISKYNEVVNKNFPICIEAENEKDLLLLKKVALEITGNYAILNSNKREQLHLAAVFVNNFVNYLYSIGNDICKSKNISFKLLKPLIDETAEKIKNNLPKDMQTGPAVRNDSYTIAKQEKLLHGIQKEIYTLLTQAIQDKNE